ncbi:hypothetical protein J3A83DRAFT_4187607 [Scleroderma citrinum]
MTSQLNTTAPHHCYGEFWLLRNLLSRRVLLECPSHVIGVARSKRQALSHFQPVVDAKNPFEPASIEQRLSGQEFHKVPCKSNAKLRAKCAERPGADAEIARLKKWNSSHMHLFRQAAVCALNLGDNPSDADTKALVLEVELKSDHESLPPSKKYRVKDGCDITLEEARGDVV